MAHNYKQIQTGVHEVLGIYDCYALLVMFTMTTIMNILKLRRDVARKGVRVCTCVRSELCITLYQHMHT